MLEKLVKYEGEELAVSVCLNPLCNFFDWEVSKRISELEELDDEEWEGWGRLELGHVLDESREWAKGHAKKIKLEFLSRQPVNIQPKAARTDIERFLDNPRLSPFTRRSYRHLLLRFVEWLEKERLRKDD
jgi:hypothetical protein